MPVTGINPQKTGVPQLAKEQGESGNSNSAPGASVPTAEESAQLAAAEKASQRKVWNRAYNDINGLDYESGQYVGVGKLSTLDPASPVTPSGQQMPDASVIRNATNVEAPNLPADARNAPIQTEPASQPVTQPQRWTAGAKSQRTDSLVAADGASSTAQRNTSASDNEAAGTVAATTVAATGIAAGRVADSSAAEEKSDAGGETTTDEKKDTKRAEDEPKSPDEQLAEANADALALSKWGSVGMGLGQMALNPIMAASSPFKRAPGVVLPEAAAISPSPAPNQPAAKPVVATHAPVPKPAVEDDAIKSATKAWQQKATAASARIAGRKSELAAKSSAIWNLAARLNPPDDKIEKLQEEVKSLAAQNKADKAIIEKARQNGQTRLLRTELADAQRVVSNYEGRISKLKGAIASNQPLKVVKQVGQRVVANPSRVVATFIAGKRHLQEFAKDKAVLKVAEARLESAEKRVASVNEQLRNLKNAPAVNAAVTKSPTIVSTSTPAPATTVSTATASTTASAPASSTKPTSSALGKVTNSLGEKLPSVGWSPVRMVAKVGSTAVWGVGTAVSGYFTYQEAQRAAEVAKSDAPPFQKVLATSTAVLSGYATSVSAIAYVGILPAMGLASLSVASATLEAILY